MITDWAQNSPLARILSPYLQRLKPRDPLPREPAQVLRIGLNRIVDIRGAAELFVARMLDAIRNG